MPRQVYDGVDTLAERRTRVSVVPFRAAVTAYVETHRAGWGSERYARQRQSSFEGYVLKTLGDRPVASISTEDCLSVLSPIWSSKSNGAD